MKNQLQFICKYITKLVSFLKEYLKSDFSLWCWFLNTICSTLRYEGTVKAYIYYLKHSDVCLFVHHLLDRELYFKVNLKTLWIFKHRTDLIIFQQPAKVPIRIRRWSCMCGKENISYLNSNTEVEIKDNLNILL